MIVNNENSGLLFVNEDADDQNKKPQISGYINVEGKQYRIALWENERGYGAKIQVNDEEDRPTQKSNRAGASGNSGRRTYTKPARR